MIRILLESFCEHMLNRVGVTFDMCVDTVCYLNHEVLHRHCRGTEYAVGIRVFHLDIIKEGGLA